MKPIRFSCRASFSQTPRELAEQILDITNWTDFAGYGPLPGIASAEFETRTPEVVGSRIAVHNRDGSTHVEQITEWNPECRVALQMQEFSAPLSRLATRIDESWDFQQADEKTLLARTFELHPRSTLTRLPLWLISRFLKRAIDRHLQQMGGERLA